MSSGAVWEDRVGYSRAIRAGHIIEVAGTTAMNEAGEVVGENDPYAQTAFILKRIARALTALGGGIEDVVRTRIYVTDISQWEEIGRAHGEVFSDIRPATAMVEVRALIDARLLVEIEATAITEP